MGVYGRVRRVCVLRVGGGSTTSLEASSPTPLVPHAVTTRLSSIITVKGQCGLRQTGRKERPIQGAKQLAGRRRACVMGDFHLARVAIKGDLGDALELEECSCDECTMCPGTSM